MKSKCIPPLISGTNNEITSRFYTILQQLMNLILSFVCVCVLWDFFFFFLTPQFGHMLMNQISIIINRVARLEIDQKDRKNIEEKGKCIV